MQMTKAQAVAELERIQELLPLIAEAVKEERKPVNRYAKTSYFKEAYGQSMGTVKNGLMLSNLRKLLLHCKVRSGFHDI